MNTSLLLLTQTGNQSSITNAPSFFKRPDFFNTEINDCFGEHNVNCRFDHPDKLLRLALLGLFAHFELLRHLDRPHFRDSVAFFSIQRMFRRDIS